MGFLDAVKRFFGSGAPDAHELIAHNVAFETLFIT